MTTTKRYAVHSALVQTVDLTNMLAPSMYPHAARYGDLYLFAQLPKHPTIPVNDITGESFYDKDSLVARMTATDEWYALNEAQGEILANTDKVGGQYD